MREYSSDMSHMNAGASSCASPRDSVSSISEHRAKTTAKKLRTPRREATREGDRRVVSTGLKKEKHGQLKVARRPKLSKLQLSCETLDSDSSSMRALRSAQGEDRCADASTQSIDDSFADIDAGFHQHGVKVGDKEGTTGQERILPLGTNRKGAPLSPTTEPMKVEEDDVSFGDHIDERMHGADDRSGFTMDGDVEFVDELKHSTGPQSGVRDVFRNIEDGGPHVIPSGRKAGLLHPAVDDSRAGTDPYIFETHNYVVGVDTFDAADGCDEDGYEQRIDMRWREHSSQGRQSFYSDDEADWGPLSASARRAATYDGEVISRDEALCSDRAVGTRTTAWDGTADEEEPHSRQGRPQGYPRGDARQLRLHRGLSDDRGDSMSSDRRRQSTIINELRSREAMAQGQIASLESRLRQLKAQQSRSSFPTTSELAKAREAVVQRDEAIGQIHYLKTRISQLQSTSESSRSACRAAQKRLSEQETSNETLRLRISKGVERTRRLEGELSAANKVVHTLRRKIERLESDLEEARAYARNVAQEVMRRESQKRCDAMKEANSRCFHLQSKIERLVDERVQLESTNKRLQMRVMEVVKANDAMERVLHNRSRDEERRFGIGAAADSTDGGSYTYRRRPMGDSFAANDRVHFSSDRFTEGGAEEMEEHRYSDENASVCTSEWSSFNHRYEPPTSRERPLRSPRRQEKKSARAQTDTSKIATDYAALMDRFRRVRNRM